MAGFAFWRDLNHLIVTFRTLVRILWASIVGLILNHGTPDWVIAVKFKNSHMRRPLMTAVVGLSSTPGVLAVSCSCSSSFFPLILPLDLNLIAFLLFESILIIASNATLLLLLIELTTSYFFMLLPDQWKADQMKVVRSLLGMAKRLARFSILLSCFLLRYAVKLFHSARLVRLGWVSMLVWVKFAARRKH